MPFVGHIASCELINEVNIIHHALGTDKEPFVELFVIYIFDYRYEYIL
jgi:hypothetical protein